jgi:16S rRNA (adenine1518-N6/adenine1519-N6)-dimethyltransferase
MGIAELAERKALMAVSDRVDVTRLLREAGLRPHKGLGQNFLVDETALRQVAQAAELTPDDLVLEIGAGLGSLTRLLAQASRRVLAVEIDAHLVDVLRQVVADLPTVEIVPGDILAIPVPALLDRFPPPVSGYKAVGNLPYYITSAVLRHLLAADVRPACLVVTVQEEVARRITAGPGEMSLLAVSVQLYGHPHITARIPAGAFYPVPKVDSAVVRIDLSGGLSVPVDDIDWFFAVARAGFSARRKQLHNPLAHALHLPAEQVGAALLRAEIDPARRAQTLALNEWARLSRELRGETGRQ